MGGGKTPAQQRLRQPQQAATASSSGVDPVQKLKGTVLQLESTLSKRNQKLKLSWTPREQNYEADELSNGITHRFRKQNEVKAEEILSELKVFNKMLKYGRALYEDLKEIKEDKKRRRQRSEEERRPTRI